MNKIIAIVTIGASTAFLRVQAQEAPQTQRTQDNVVQSTSDAPSAAEAKTEIETSELPSEVMDSFENGEYGDMDIVTVYEVSTPGSDSASASTQLKEAANQTEQAVGTAATGMEQNAENVAEETQTTAAEASQDVQEEASDFAQNTEQAASDATQPTDEMATDTVQMSDAVIEGTPHSVADTAINEVNSGEAVQEDMEVATTPTQQPADSASASGDTAAPQEDPMTETATTEDMEDTGQVVSAETPAEEDPATQPAEDMEEKGERLYENNQYDNYTGANSTAYEEIAEEQEPTNFGQEKQYELEVRGEAGNMTLTYDENGELVKADKGSM